MLQEKPWIHLLHGVWVPSLAYYLRGLWALSSHQPKLSHQSSPRVMHTKTPLGSVHSSPKWHRCKAAWNTQACTTSAPDICQDTPGTVYFRWLSHQWTPLQRSSWEPLAHAHLSSSCLIRRLPGLSTQRYPSCTASTSAVLLGCPLHRKPQELPDSTHFSFSSSARMPYA